MDLKMLLLISLSDLGKKWEAGADKLLRSKKNFAFLLKPSVPDTPLVSIFDNFFNHFGGRGALSILFWMGNAQQDSESLEKLKLVPRDSESRPRHQISF